MRGHQRSFVTQKSGTFYDILIVGGGVMGSSIAHHLSRRVKGEGVKIGVVEPDPTYTRSATTLSVGGLRQQFSLEENIQMGLFALQFMRGLPAVLGGDPDTVPDVKFQPHGYLFLASDAGYQILQENHANQLHCGAATKLLTEPQLGRLFPWINTEGVVAGCYGADNEGWFDPWALLQAFKVKVNISHVNCTSK